MLLGYRATPHVPDPKKEPTGLQHSRKEIRRTYPYAQVPRSENDVPFPLGRKVEVLELSRVSNVGNHSVNISSLSRTTFFQIETPNASDHLLLQRAHDTEIVHFEENKRRRLGITFLVCDKQPRGFRTTQFEYAIA